MGIRLSERFSVCGDGERSLQGPLLSLKSCYVQLVDAVLLGPDVQALLPLCPEAASLGGLCFVVRHSVC